MTNQELQIYTQSIFQITTTPVRQNLENAQLLSLARHAHTKVNTNNTSHNTEEEAKTHRTIGTRTKTRMEV